MLKKLSILFLVVFVSGCTVAPNQLGQSFIIKTVDPMIATSEVSTGKKGTTCATNFASLISYGDMSIEAAKANGGITKVSTVSQSVESISFLYTKKCTIVIGS